MRHRAVRVAALLAACSWRDGNNRATRPPPRGTSIHYFIAATAAAGHRPSQSRSDADEIWPRRYLIAERKETRGWDVERFGRRFLRQEPSGATASTQQAIDVYCTISYRSPHYRRIRPLGLSNADSRSHLSSANGMLAACQKVTVRNFVHLSSITETGTSLLQPQLHALLAK